MTQPAGQKHSSGLLLIIILVQLFAFGLWVGGPRADMNVNCVLNVALGDHFGHSINCDSTEFILAAADISNVLEPESKRQSRPGTVLLVHLLTRPPVWLVEAFSTGPPEMISFHDVESDNEVAFAIERHEVIAGYMGYLLLHLVILVVSYIFYLRLAGLGRGQLKMAAALAGITVFVNNITKQFLWSPHTQLFNLLAPLLAMWLFVKMLQTERPDRLFFITALGCGLGMLFYGIFVLPVTIAGLGWLWRRRECLRDLKKLAQLFAYGLAAIAVFMIPYALWYGFVIWRNGTFYNYDVEFFKGFVWLGEVVQAQGLGQGLFLLLQNFLQMFWGAIEQGWGYMLALAGLVYAARRQPQREEKDKPGGGVLWIGAGLYSVLAAVFFAFYGLTVYRLSFTITATLLPLIGFYLHDLERHAARPSLLKGGVLAVACIYIMFMLVKFGPYS